MSDNRKLGIGGAPTRATSLPTDSKGRKEFPVASGFMDYFPDAIAAVAHLSYLATKQHHPDKPMHWNRAVSNDEDDTMMRHFLQRGTRDTDGERHSAKMVWRALAMLQKEIEAEQTQTEPPAEQSFYRPSAPIQIRPGPYCEDCDKVATRRYDNGPYSTPTFWCAECADRKILSRDRITLMETA